MWTSVNVVSWNRVVLLHGPPGTESGKLVQRLFSTVTDMVEEEDTFVVVLIDEVESLTSARAGAMAGTEPSDALRVVNALLTQLDKLKHRKNVLVMSTSNLAKAIDTAFVDRADIIQYVDLPPREAIYEIMRTCLSELITKGIIADVDVPSLAQAQLYERTAEFSSVLDHQPARSTAAAHLPVSSPNSQPHHEAQQQLLRLGVLRRCYSTLIPKSPSYISDHLSPADLYGPFWTLTTLIFSLFVFSSLASSIAAYLSDPDASSPTDPIEYDFGLLSTAVVAIVRWVLVGIAFLLSGYFLMINVYPILASADAKAVRLISILIVLLHAALALCFKVLFFSYYAVKPIGPADPIPDPIS
ncbi:hypothetical protein EW026_g4392 [Hermanssonia centrifuga]|uniref:ATPase AAA-type core domain-containing protein n=1 Tax=Hermanssonia centrifuga TaxID=98765 RepID=A0A4S4KHB6_9APHY|nr:hypothetical protein EW026_g4392 [Hermanssonia centrifuga]